MSALTNQVGINISNTSIQLVEISKKQNEVFLMNVDEEFFEENLDPNFKETKFIHILQNSFNEILLRKPLNTKKVSVSLPLNFSKIFELPIDKNLTKNDIAEYCNWEFSKLFPTENIKDFRLEKINLETPTYQSFCRYMVYGLKTDLLKRIFKFCLRNNLTLKLADISHVSANSLLLYTTASSNYFSFWIEDKSISLMYINNGNLAFSKSKYFTDIADVPIFIKNIFSEIENKNLLKNKTTDLIFLGSTISNELINYFNNMQNINFKIFNSIEEIKLNVSYMKNFENVNSIKYNAALGMALRQIT